jgi:hypothetical protein
MLTTIIVAIALATGLVLPHAHTANLAPGAHAHVTSLDGNGGGPPIHP